jgi:hypothetical protein
MIQPRVPEYSRPKKKTVKFVAGQKVRGPIFVRRNLHMPWPVTQRWDK